MSPFCLGLTVEPETVVAAFDAGINFFFVTADMHWPVYESTRRGLELLLSRGLEIREQIVVAGACYPCQPEFCTAPFWELIDAVEGLHGVDVLIAGGAYAWELPQRWPVYAQHRRTGFVNNRAVGATFHDRRAARSVLAEAQMDIAFIRYNPAHSGARVDVFPHTGPGGPLLFGFKSTSGYLTPARMEELGLPAPDCWHPDITDHYRFALTAAAMDGLLIALRTPAEVRALEKALEKGPLSLDEEEYLLDLVSVVRGEAHVVAAG